MGASPFCPHCNDPSDTPFRFAPLTMPRPIGLTALIEHMVDMDPACRPATMKLIRQELERLLNDSTAWRVADALGRPGWRQPAASVQTTGAYPHLASSPPSWQSPPPAWQSQNTSQTAQGGPPVQAPPINQKPKAVRWLAGAILFFIGVMALYNLGQMGRPERSGCFDL